MDLIEIETIYVMTPTLNKYQGSQIVHDSNLKPVQH